jgi:hypothetical protein
MVSIISKTLFSSGSFNMVFHPLFVYQNFAIGEMNDIFLLNYLLR